MSKILADILLNRVVEVYDGNTVSGDYSSRYIQQLMKSRLVDDDVEVDIVSDDDIEPEELYAHLVHFSHNAEDDEMTISYDDGQSVTIDDEVAKYLITYASVEDIENAGRDIEHFHSLMYRIYDEIISIEDKE